MADFKYDVAFSFVGEDEGIAVELSELLAGRLSTFVYSERQKEIAGTGGEETFNRVYGHEARTVVVLHRPSWGETPFTRIEATAIRNRAFDQGYDFATFIPVGEPHTVPPWVPKTRLWVNLQRFGMKAAAAVIEARVESAGGEPRIESAADIAGRVQRAIELEQDRKEFQFSKEGIDEATKSFYAFIAATQETVKSVAEQGINLHVSEPGPTVTVSGFRGLFLSLEWRTRFSNSLDESGLIAAVGQKKGRWGDLEWLSQQVFHFTLFPGQGGMWYPDGDLEKAFTPYALAEELIKQYVQGVPRE